MHDDHNFENCGLLSSAVFKPVLPYLELHDFLNMKFELCCCYFFSAPVAAPENLMVVNISANELNVSWERPNEINTNGILRYYIIDYYIVNQEETMTSTNVSGETLFTVLSGLNNFTTYSVSVAAFTVGTGPSSTELETTSENGE